MSQPQEELLDPLGATGIRGQEVGEGLGEDLAGARRGITAAVPRLDDQPLRPPGSGRAQGLRVQRLWTRPLQEPHRGQGICPREAVR
jgi:hypothetical protein